MTSGEASDRTLVVVVSGASGLVGQRLVPALEQHGHLVRKLVRRDVGDGEHEIRWDPEAGTIDREELNGVDAVVHLAGENIASRRWNADVKQAIRDSRVRGTELLSKTLAGLSSKPSVLCSASAIGYYGDRGDQGVDEKSASGEGFLAGVCREWEAATAPAREAGIRVVNLRIGVVLHPKGGALKQMLTPFKLGLGGVIGDGHQYMSWITCHDLVRVIERTLLDDSLCGPINAVAPEPVTNRQFTKTLGRVLRRPTLLSMPAFAARIALGEMADEMLLGGARVEPKRLQELGFRFDHPELEKALRTLLK